MVAGYARCDTAGFFAYRKKLKAKRHTPSKAMTRGQIGHLALERYYLSKQQGGTQESCKSVILESLNESAEEYSDYPEILKEIDLLRETLPRYVDIYWDEPWEILEVEKQYGLPIDGGGDEYGMRIDMLVRDTNTGHVIIVDHKITYDFIKMEDIKLDSQMPLYIHSLRQLGVHVDYALYNQIRHRHLKDPSVEDLYRRDVLKYKDQVIENHVLKFMQGYDYVIEQQSKPEDDQLRESRMALDKISCKSCSFKPLCTDILNDRNWRATSHVLYEHNDYMDGYVSESLQGQVDTN